MKNGHRDEKLPRTVGCIEPGCSACFTTETIMRQHYRNIHQQPKIYMCPECGEIFKRKQVLKRHRFTHTGVFPYTCATCGRGSINLKESKRHEASHNASRPRSCEDCGKSFKSWSALVAHRKVALHSNEFKCEQCNRVFPVRSSLKYHLEIHKDQESREVIECPFKDCPKFYFEKRNLTAHIRSKHEGTKFVCGFNDCGRLLSSKTTLIKHLKLHLAEREGLRPPSRPSSCPPSRSSSRAGSIKPRKDKGGYKKASALILAGLVERSEVHRALLANEADRLEIQTSSDIEIN